MSTYERFTQNPPRRVYSVSEFSGEVRNLLEDSYPDLWIEGEISNLSNPRSGHSYFSLKDDDSQIRCALFRQRKLRCKVIPKEGDRVLMRAKVSLYTPRGDFQLIVDYMEDAGEGALRRAMEALKRQLQAEGLFDAARKRPLPEKPTTIGIVTSPTGAAVRDTLITLKRHAPWISVIVYPCLVQGENAPAALVAMLETAGRRAECDLLLLVRGGGSLEDLMAFNDEQVARAIARSPIPVISGVGHETDTTIADHVADERAATPTAAAQRAVAYAADFRKIPEALQDRLVRNMERRLSDAMQRVDRLAAGMRHPMERISMQQARLSEIAHRFSRAANNRLSGEQMRFNLLATQFNAANPSRRIQATRYTLSNLEQRLRHAFGMHSATRLNRLDTLEAALRQLNPANTLARGYSVITDSSGERVISSVTQVEKGTAITARLADGELDVSVDDIRSS